MNDKLPLRTVQRIMKEHFDGEISQDACIYVKNYVHIIICDLVQLVISEFKETNTLREKHGLPRLKRLDRYSFQSVSSKYPQQIYLNGEIGQSNRELFCHKKKAEEVVSYE